jgi:dTDP-4-dehydrorhamnose reductase
MKILVTGAGGQLGQALQDLLRNSSVHQIIPCSRNDLDIARLADVEQTLAKYSPDAVVNAAAYNFVDKAESEPGQAMTANKTGPENLAKATAKKKVPLVHVSTDYVFDGAKTKPYLESDKPNPLSVYAKSKFAGEEVVLKNSPHAYVVRTAWVYHPVGRNFLLTILSLKDKPELKIVNDQFGSPTYAPHLAQGIVSLLEKRPPFGLYHMAGSGQTNWFDLASALFQQLGVKTPLRPIPGKDYSYKATRPRFTVLSTEKKPSFMLPAWERGLEDFVKVIRHHGM